MRRKLIFETTEESRPSSVGADMGSEEGIDLGIEGRKPPKAVRLTPNSGGKCPRNRPPLCGYITFEYEGLWVQFPKFKTNPPPFRV
jgi:hypothetical protein